MMPGFVREPPTIRIHHQPGAVDRMCHPQTPAARDLPFGRRVPNAETRQAIGEMENASELPHYHDVDALFDEIESDD